jgi:hypothetical protein
MDVTRMCTHTRVMNVIFNACSSAFCEVSLHLMKNFCTNFQLFLLIFSLVSLEVVTVTTFPFPIICEKSKRFHINDSNSNM